MQFNEKKIFLIYLISRVHFFFGTDNLVQRTYIHNTCVAESAQRSGFIVGTIPRFSQLHSKNRLPPESSSGQHKCAFFS